MTGVRTGRIGVQFGSTTQPSLLRETVASAERLGYSEAWLA